MRTETYTVWAGRKFWKRPDYKLGRYYSALKFLAEMFREDKRWETRDAQMNRVVCNVQVAFMVRFTPPYLQENRLRQVRAYNAAGLF